MENQELSPEARKALAQCYHLLIQWGRETMAEVSALSDQRIDEEPDDTPVPTKTRVP